MKAIIIDDTVERPTAEQLFGDHIIELYARCYENGLQTTELLLNYFTFNKKNYNYIAIRHDVTRDKYSVELGMRFVNLGLYVKKNEKKELTYKKKQALLIEISKIFAAREILPD